MLRQNYYLFIITLIMMGSCSLFATDIFVPALPSMTDFFRCSEEKIKTSFTLFLIGLASCQFITGVLADKFGRKKVAVVGFSIFVLATFLCTLAENINQFLGLRLLQAIGAGVGSVINRTIVVDKFSRQDSVKVFSTIFPIIGLSAAIAPMVGGCLTDFLHWHATFYFMMGFGIVTIILVLLSVEEKKQHNLQEIEKDKKWYAQHYLEIFRNREYLGYVLIICTGFCVFRIFTAESSFLFDKLGYTASGMGHFYIPLSIAYIIGNLFAKRLVSTYPVEKVLRVGLFFFILGGSCMVFAARFCDRNPYIFVLPMVMITLGNGLLFPLASAGAMTAVNNHLSGLASGFMGFMQCISAALAIYCVGSFCHGDALKISLFLGGTTVLTLVSYFLMIAYRSNTIAQET